MYKLLLILLLACNQPETSDVRGQWLHPDPVIPILSNFMGSEDICLSFQPNSTLYVIAPTHNEYLDYSFNEDTQEFDIQYIGHVFFYEEDNAIKTRFSNKLIDDGAKDVVWRSCEPW